MPTTKKTEKTYFDSDENLTEQQEEFAQLFVNSYRDKDFAYIGAGYKAENENSKRVAICKLMKNKKIINRIDELMAERKKNNSEIVDKIWITEKLKRIVNNEADRPQYQLKALELLAKALGMLTDVQEIREGETNPADIAKEVFKKRQELNAAHPNILEFKATEEVTNGNDSAKTNS